MKYFAMIDGCRIGPLELTELADAGVRPDTYVWCKGMADWQQAREVADICRFFRRRLHDRMHPDPVQADLPARAADKEQNSWNQLREINVQIIDCQEVENEADPPTPCPLWLIILSFIGCLPLGLLALISNRQMHRAWKQNRAAEAHSAARRAKMAGGIGACLIFIMLAAVIH